MKKLFLISEEEKQRILEMHSPKKVVSEQLIPSKPTGGVKSGTEINLYPDAANAEPPTRFKIVDVHSDPDGTVSLEVLTREHKGGKAKLKMTYMCANDFLGDGKTIILHKMNPDAPEGVVGAVLNYTKLYSSSFVSALRNQFCQKNQKGLWVPKAAYASTGTPESPIA